MIIQVNSGPGSGKTTTAKNVYRHQIARIPLTDIQTSEEQKVIYDFVQTHWKFPKSVAYFCLNNTTKNKLKKEVHRNADVYNFHGFGQSQLTKKFGYQVLDTGRTEGFIEDIIGRKLADLPNAEKWYWLACKKLVTYLKQEFLPPTEVNKEFIFLKYPDLFNLQLPVDWVDRCTKLLALSSVPNRKLEWVDMVWLAAKKIKKTVYQYGIVDESQDNSAMTLALLQASCENLMFFGDPNQAINAFAGADHEMFNKIEGMADFTFPLKQTFRCPPAIVHRANEIRPGGVLEGPNKATSKIANIEHTQMQRMLVDLPPRDVLIVARTNASTISAALRLLTGDPYIDCHIPEKDLYKSTCDYINKLHPKTLDQLYDRLDEEKEKAANMRNTIAAMNILDRCISIEYFMEQSDDLEDLFANMEKVLCRKTGHKLLTLHSAKGLEAKNIFILNPPVEHPLALQNPISAQQEYNLHFVGITRSSLNLFYVQ